jgi:hypothetical protein
MSLLDAFNDRAVDVERGKAVESKVAGKVDISRLSVEPENIQAKLNEQSIDKGKKSKPETLKRADYVEGLLNGSIKLSKEFNSKYRIEDWLGDGAFGFVVTARKLDDNSEVLSH